MAEGLVHAARRRARYEVQLARDMRPDEYDDARFERLALPVNCGWCGKRLVADPMRLPRLVHEDTLAFNCGRSVGRC